MTTGNVADTRDVSARGMMFALARLVSGKADAMAFVEIGPDAVSVQTLEVDADGVPVLCLEASVRWTVILPELPAAKSLRYEQMASDIGTVQCGPAMTAALEPQLRLLIEVAAAAGCSPGRRRRLDVVLVNRAHGWALLEAAVTSAGTVLRPIAEVIAAPGAGTLPKVISALAARAPLRYGYDLILVDVDQQTRAVRPLARELFPAGSSALLGARSEATVTVSPVAGHAAKVLALPIVARRGTVPDLRDAAALAEHLPLVKMVAVGSGKWPAEVRIRLAGPGHPHVLEATEARTAQPNWPEVIKELPAQLPPANPPWELSRPGDLDVAVLVELGGASADVAARVGLARGVVRKFRGVPDARVRIGVLGYREHYGPYHKNSNLDPGREGRALVIGARLSKPSEAASVLDRDGWRDSVPIVHPYAAPVEDALRELADDKWGWRPDARHVVIIIGRRPPHPDQYPERREDHAPHGDDLRPCRYGIRWQEVLSQLSKHQVELHAVLDQVPAPGYDARTWRDFGASQASLRRDSAERIARTLGLMPPPRFRIPLATHSAPPRPASGKRARKAGQ
jgi:hypothetical protein